MDIMIDCSNYGSWICELMSGEWIFIPRALEAIQFVIKVAIVNVEFVWVDANDGTCIWRMSLFSLHNPREYVTHIPKKQSRDNFASLTLQFADESWILIASVAPR